MFFVICCVYVWILTFEFVRMCAFSNMWMCVCFDFVMFGSVVVGLKCGDICIDLFRNVWVCECVFLVICGCVGLVICGFFNLCVVKLYNYFIKSHTPLHFFLILHVCFVFHHSVVTFTLYTCVSQSSSHLVKLLNL